MHSKPTMLPLRPMCLPKRPSEGDDCELGARTMRLKSTARTATAANFDVRLPLGRGDREFSASGLRPGLVPYRKAV